MAAVLLEPDASCLLLSSGSAASVPANAAWKFIYVLVAFLSSVFMVVMQKFIFETQTIHGVFQRYVFMANVTALSKASLLAFPAIVFLQERSGRQLVEHIWFYARSVRLAVFIWIPSLVLESWALTQLSASVLVMMRSLNIPITAMMRVSCLGFKKESLSQVLLLLVVTGGIMAGVFLSTEGNTDGGATWAVRPVGYYLGLCAAICVAGLTATRFVVEEKCIRHNIPPMMVTGIEGCMVLTVLLGVLAASHILQVENLRLTWLMLNTHPYLMYYVILYMGLNYMYTWSMINVTAEISSTTRVIIRGLSIYGTWALQLCVAMVSHGHHGEQWVWPQSAYYACACTCTVLAALAYHSDPSATGKSKGTCGEEEHEQADKS